MNTLFLAINKTLQFFRHLFNPLITIVSLLLSVASLYVAYKSSISSNAIASEALATARQANEITLGRIRESAILEFTSDENKTFDFRSNTELQKELHYYLSFSNRGKKPVEGATFEIIGITPLTYRLDDVSDSPRNLPSIVVNTNFNSAVQPSGSVHLDVRKMLFLYLAKLSKQLPNKNADYHTTVNIVVAAKGLGESTAVGDSSTKTPRDRALVSVKFKPSVVDLPISKEIIDDSYIVNRVYSPS